MRTCACLIEAGFCGIQKLNRMPRLLATDRKRGRLAAEGRSAWEWKWECRKTDLTPSFAL